ncbi:hypothetical protein HDU78_008831 [Chytriomyces hyalinus]|nr:hypothetical protein HDU78_008831 [Chytriomyces hyalinus]
MQAPSLRTTQKPRIAKNPLESHWLHSLPVDRLPSSPPPSSAFHFDVAIVGAGLSGFSTALHLSRLSRGTLRIAVLDARGVAGGASGRNGGLVRPGVPGAFESVVALHGREEAQRLGRFEFDSVAAMQQFVSECGDDTEWTELKKGGFKALSTTDNRAEVEKDIHEWEEAGCNIQAHLVSREQVVQLTGCKVNRNVTNGAVQFREWRVNPAKLVLAVASSTLRENSNAYFYKECLVEKVVPDATRNLFSLETSKGSFFARKVVYATNAWTSAILPELEITPVRNQVISTVPSSNPFWKDGTFAFIANAGREYMSGRGDGRIVLGGMRYLAKQEDFGCDRDDALNKTVSAALKLYLPSKFDGFENEQVAVEREWAGIMGFTADKSPYVGSLEAIGRGKEFVIAGFCGHGMTRCFLSGRAVAEMVLGLPISGNFPRSYLPTAARIVGPARNHCKLEDYGHTFGAEMQTIKRHTRSKLPLYALVLLSVAAWLHWFLCKL